MGSENTSAGERSTLEGSFRTSDGGWSGSENVDLSNANIGENPMSRKSKGSSGFCLDYATGDSGKVKVGENSFLDGFTT